MTSPVKLPGRSGAVIWYKAHDKLLQVKKVRAGVFFMQIVAEQRARWGNAEEAREDVAHFLTYGGLPQAKQNWA